MHGKKGAHEELPPAGHGRMLQDLNARLHRIEEGLKLDEESLRLILQRMRLKRQAITDIRKQLLRGKELLEQPVQGGEISLLPPKLSSQN